MTEVNPLQVGTKKLKSRLGIRIQDMNVLTTRLTRSSNSKTEEQKKNKKYDKSKTYFRANFSFVRRRKSWSLIIILINKLI